MTKKVTYRSSHALAAHPVAGIAAAPVSHPLAVFGAPPAAVIDGNAAAGKLIRIKLFNIFFLNLPDNLLHLRQLLQLQVLLLLLSHIHLLFLVLLQLLYGNAAVGKLIRIKL